MELPPLILSAHNYTTNSTYSIEPDPIYGHQSWVSKFENIRRFEHDEFERELRREREHSNDGLIEALVVVGIIAMVVIPFLIWLYYKSGICDPNQDRFKTPMNPDDPKWKYTRAALLQRRRESRQSLEGVNFVPPLKVRAASCPNPCVCVVESELQSKKNKYRALRENAPYAPAAAAVI